MSIDTQEKRTTTRFADGLKERLLKLQADLIRNQNGRHLPFNGMVNELLELAIETPEVTKPLYARHWLPKAGKPRSAKARGANS